MQSQEKRLIDVLINQTSSQWIPPSLGLLKVNVDGAITVSNNKEECDRIIRDHLRS